MRHEEILKNILPTCLVHTIRRSMAVLLGNICCVPQGCHICVGWLPASATLGRRTEIAHGHEYANHSFLQASATDHPRTLEFAATKILNVSISVGGVLITFIASWYVDQVFLYACIIIALYRYIYRLMRREILHLEGIPPEIDELAEEAIEEAAEGAPLLGPHSESRVRYDGSSA